jgi:hypothetical protein
MSHGSVPAAVLSPAVLSPDVLGADVIGADGVSPDRVSLDSVSRDSVSRDRAAAARISGPAGGAGAATRSARPVSRLPAWTSGSASSARRNETFVVTPRIAVSARAASRRRRAVARSSPHAITFASIGS